MKKNRFLAATVDFVICSLLGLTIMFGLIMLGFPEDKISPKLGNYVMVLYYTFLLGGLQMTLGTKWRRIKVITTSGEDIGYGRAWWRSSLYVAFLTIFTLGIIISLEGYSLTAIICLIMGCLNFIVAFWDKDQRCLHDRFSGTKVLSTIN